MIIKSITKTAKGSPRKLRIPARVIKGMKVSEAIATLSYIPKEGARLINKTLKTALSDAVHNFKKSEDNLIVLDVRIDESMKLRRYRPAAKGMAKPFIKKYSHITVLVKDINDIESKEKSTKTSKSQDKKVKESKEVKKSSAKNVKENSSNVIEEGEIVKEKPVKKESVKNQAGSKVSKDKKKTSSTSKSKVAKK